MRDTMNKRQRTIKDIERHYTTLLEMYTNNLHEVVENEDEWSAKELMINICEHAISEAKYYAWSREDGE